jgi:hypothetical protein
MHADEKRTRRAVRLVNGDRCLRVPPRLSAIRLLKELNRRGRRGARRYEPQARGCPDCIAFTAVVLLHATRWYDSRSDRTLHARYARHSPPARDFSTLSILALEVRSFMAKQEGAAAVVAYTSPFRLIFRDKNDKWAPTLDDVNHKTYDYVKLHRLSASLNIGLPAPLCMYITFDGSLLLPKIDKFWPVENSVSAFNEILGLIIVGGIYFGPVEPTDIDQGVVYKTGYYRSYGLACGLVGKVRMALQDKLASVLDSSLLYEPQHVFVLDVLKAYDDGKSICSQIPSLSPEFLVHGVSAFISHDWGTSLSELFISVEQIIEQLWKVHVIDGERQPNSVISGRNEFLTDYRTWTTSARIEVLFQKHVLPPSTYGLLSIARKARNDLVHSGQVPGRAAAEAALDGVFQLIACATTPDKIDCLSARVEAYKKLDPIQRHYAPQKAIPVKDAGGLWIGPLPPIPGDKEWGDKPYENVFELAAIGSQPREL